MAGVWPTHAQTVLDGDTVSVTGDSSFPDGPPVIFQGTSTLEFAATGTPIDVTLNMMIEAGQTGIMDTSAATLPVILSGNISGDGSLEKTGAGTLALSGINSFTGGTSVEAGILALIGSGSLVSGAQVDVAAGATFAIGNDINTNFSGTINLANQGSDPSYGMFAKTGAGTLTIDGTTISGGEAYVVEGALAQTAGSTSIDYLAVGTGLGNTGGLNVSGGTLAIGTGLQVGDFGGEGTVTQTAGTVRLLATCGDIARCPSLNIGNQGGTGFYNISGGTLELNGGLNNIGRSQGTSPASNGTLNISDNGLVWVRPTTDFGRGALIIGSRDSTTDLGGQGEGAINQTGGTLRIENGSELYLSGYGDGTYNLSGGTLQIGGNSLQAHYGGGAATGTYEFNFGGGTIQVYDTALITNVNANLVADTFSTIDTNGLGATFSGVFSGDGTLAKTGAGTLVLTGINTYSGGTNLDGGTLSVGAEANLGDLSGALNFDGGILQVTGTTFTSTVRSINWGANGGGFDIADAANIFTVNQALSGSGGLAKLGDGTLVLSGANNYTGATAVNAGILQAGGADAFAPSSAFTVASLAILDLNSLDQTIGSLAGSGNVQLGTGFLTTGGNNSSTSFSGVIDGDGGLTKTGTGTFTLAGDNTYTGPTTVSGGVLSVNGSIVSPTTVEAGAALEGTGSLGPLTALAGGIVAPGNSIGTLTVNGNFTLDPGAIFEVEANALGQADKIIVNGTVNLSGAVLRVLAANGAYKPKTDYLIVDNDGADAVEGTFAEITSNLAFLTPSVIYNGGDGNDVVLTLLRTNGPGPGPGPTPLSFCSAAVSENQCNVAHALDLFPTDNALFLAVVTQTVEGARQAFDALSGEIHATLPGVLADDSRYVREAVLGRLVQATYTNNAGQVAALGSGGPQVASLNAYDAQAMAVGYDGKHLAPPPAPSYGAAFWTRAYGAWGDFDGNGNAASADRDLGGFISGVDTQISNNWRAGLAAGGAWSNVSIGDRHSNADIDSFNLAGYVGGLAGPLALRGGGSWTWSEIDTERAVIFPGFFERQDSSYDADTGQIFGEIAYPTTAGRIAFEPFVGLAYVSIDTDSFRERGDTLASLTGSSDDEDIGYSTLGLRAATVTQISNMTIVPKISAAWQHAFDDVTPGASLAFASTGIGFGVSGVPLAEDSFLLEAGLDFAISATATLGVSYTGQFADEVSDNGVKGRLSWLF